MVNPARPNRFQQNRMENNMRRDRDRRNDRTAKIDRPRRPDAASDDKERSPKEPVKDTKAVSILWRLCCIFYALTK